MMIEEERMSCGVRSARSKHQADAEDGQPRGPQVDAALHDAAL